MIKIIALVMILISNVLALEETTSIEKVKSRFPLWSYSLDKKIVENLNMIEDRMNKVMLNEQQNYLISLVENPQNKMEKFTAMFLLGQFKSEKSIEILGKNISFKFKDPAREMIYRPAVYALISIGDKCLPKMIEIIEESDFNNPEDFKRVEAAINVIQVIEGSLYNYIQKHKSTVSQKVKDALIYDVLD